MDGMRMIGLVEAVGDTRTSGCLTPFFRTRTLRDHPVPATRDGVLVPGNRASAWTSTRVTPGMNDQPRNLASRHSRRPGGQTGVDP